MAHNQILDSGDPTLFDVRCTAPGPAGALPITPEMLLTRPSGELFGWSQNAGMGWDPRALGGKEILILSTHGGIRDATGAPIALGYHTGHWEVGLMMEAAARELKALGAIPFAAYCTDPCDGRTQGTTGMFDSLPYRNDAATVFGRLIRSLPTRRGVIGVATCDKGLPAMMMALASMHDLPCVLAPGGVTLLAAEGEDAGRVQSVGARFAHNQVTLEARGLKMRDILTDASVRNAMVVHAAFGGSTNLILHLPAVAHSAGLRRPTAADWTATNRRVARLVDALPNGPRSFATVQVFLAGGVPEVMLHLRRAGLLDSSVLTVSGQTLDAALDWWEASARRAELRRQLQDRDGIDPDDVIMDPAHAARAGLTSTVTFPHGNLAPEGSVIKSTAIDPSVVGPDGVYRKTGPARVFRTEAAAIAAIKSHGADRVNPGDVIVLICRGPMGSGMEETYQITSALKYLDFGKHVAVLTDARFSGVSTGACIGHITPEALAGGPIGKVLDGDIVEIVVDRVNLEGSVNLVGHGADLFGAEVGARVLGARPLRPDLAPDPALPPETRLWAALQQVSGGTWGGCVYDPGAILKALGVGQASTPTAGL